MHRKVSLLLSCALMLAAAPALSQAQGAYPLKPIRMVVPLQPVRHPIPSPGC